MGIPNLRKAAFDVDYAQSGSLYLAHPDSVVEQLNSLYGCEDSLPVKYQEKVLQSFVNFLVAKAKERGKESFCDEDSNTSKLIKDYTGAFFQRIRRQGPVPSSFVDLVAFQTVVSAVYNFALDKFRKCKALPDAPLAPLAKWGVDEDCISSRCVKDMAEPGLKIGAGLIVFPARYRMGGLFAWAVLSHEVGGHSMLDSCPEVIKEWSLAIQKQVHLTVDGESYGPGFLDEKYWSDIDRVEELAADVLGVLVSGPAFGTGLIGYLRGSNHGILNLSASSRIKHPPHVLRAVAVARVIELLNPQSPYVELITQEINQDIGDDPSINFSHSRGETEIPFEFAKKTVESVATVIATASLEFFEGKCLMELISWGEEEDLIVLGIQKSMQKKEETMLPSLHCGGSLTRYIIPAAILTAIEDDSDIPTVFEKMKNYLIDAHGRYALKATP